MKNANKALSLLISAAALVSIASCGKPVTSKQGTLVSYTDNSGAVVDFTTNDLLLNYLQKDTTASVEEYYNIAYDAMVKKYFNDPSRADLLESITRDAKNEVKKKKQQAENAADTNKTKYEDEWKAILDSELSNLKESRRNADKLLDKYLTAKMREKIADIFYDEFNKTLTDSNKEDALQKKYNIFWGENGYLEKRIPYHVKHILVKVGAADGALYNAEITSENADKLHRVITSLAKGQDFGDVARLQSDDSSNSSFGNLGIMDTATSFVNEFKLSTYIYDTLFNTTDENVMQTVLETADPFNMGDQTQFFEDLGVAEIPYGAVLDLYNYRNITEDENGKKVNEDNPLYYPRNILFNKYFNNHNFGFITLSDSNAAELNDEESNLSEAGVTKKTGTDGKEYYTDLNDEGKWTTTDFSGSTDGLNGFKEIEVNGSKKQVLCDDNGNPILVVRAGTADYQGIHLISIERSGLAKNETYEYNGQTYNSSLTDYYAAINPKLITGKFNEEFPLIPGTKLPQKTYINNVVTSYNDYNTRVDTLKNTIKNFDPSYDKKVFQWLQETLSADGTTIKVTINTTEGAKEINVTDKINKYVEREIAEHNSSSFTISADTWEGYRNYIENQQEERATKLVPETCAIGYESGKGYTTICKYSKEK